MQSKCADAKKSIRYKYTLFSAVARAKRTEVFKFYILTFFAYSLHSKDRLSKKIHGVCIFDIVYFTLLTYICPNVYTSISDSAVFSANLFW
jgi:hypothetical protein